MATCLTAHGHCSKLAETAERKLTLPSKDTWPQIRSGRMLTPVQQAVGHGSFGATTPCGLTYLLSDLQASGSLQQGCRSTNAPGLPTLSKRCILIVGICSMCFPETFGNCRSWLQVVLKKVAQNAGLHNSTLSLDVTDESSGRQVQFHWSCIAS